MALMTEGGPQAGPHVVLIGGSMTVHGGSWLVLPLVAPETPELRGSLLALRDQI